MKRIFTVLLLLVLLLSSCSTLDHIDLKGDSSRTDLTHKEDGVLYVANKSSTTYHLSSCYMAKRIEEGKRFETYDEEFLTKRQYSPCKICEPDKNK